MTYVSYLSARGVVRNTLIILALGLVLFAVTVQHAHAGRIPWEQMGHMQLLASMTGLAGFFALIVATIRSSSLDVLTRTPAITFTRPISRTVIALQNFALDAATIAIVWLITLGILTAIIAAFGGIGYLGSPSDALVVVGLVGAVMVMWYGLVTLATTLFPARGGAIVGISWAAFIVTPAVARIPFPQPVSGLLHALLFLDPMAYLTGIHGSISFGSDESDTSALIFSVGLRSAVAAVIGIIALAAAIQVWNRKDAVA